MNAQVISADGSVQSKKLSKDVFGVEVHPHLLLKALRVHSFNKRNSIANTKRKGEVAGGGRKPYRQKGTGHARQGSTRNPHYIGGGVAFGPLSERNFSRKLNGHEKVLARFAALSMVAKEKKLFIADIDTKKAKLADYKDALGALSKYRSVLLVGTGEDLMVSAVANVKNITTIQVETLSVENILNHEVICFTSAAMKAFLSTYELTE